MKKTITALMVTAGLWVNAQDLPYTFTTTTAVYQEFSDGISINQGQTWDDPEWVVPIGFDFEYMDLTFNSLFFGGLDGYGGELLLGDVNGTSFQQLMPYFQDLVDGGYFDDTPSESPVSYRVTGQPGSRVFWLQWSNVAFYNEDPPHPMRINFQLRLYEGSNIIHFHYGPNANLDVTVIQDYNGIVIGMSKDLDMNELTTEAIWALSGTPENPTPVAYTTLENFYSGTHLTTSPSPNTQYVFDPAMVSVSEQDREDVKVYPTAVIGNLNVVLPGNVPGRMRITDNTGRLLADEAVRPGYQQFSTDHWSTGHYIVTVQTADRMQTIRVVKY